LKENRIKIIDSLRGIAALIVVFHHFMVFNSTGMQSHVNHNVWSLLLFISDLNIEAVLFFFIISGFCIGLSLKGILPIQKSSFKNYLIKRCRRILPIYFIGLIMAFLSGLIINRLSQDNSFSFINLAGNLLFLQTPISVVHWFSPYGNNGPLWSLSYEMFFYIFFPIFSILLVKRSIKTTYLITSLLLIITTICLVINRYLFFLPWFSFLSLFIIWYFGYILFQHYTSNKRNHAFFIFVFSISTTICFYKDLIPSDSLYLVFKGLLMASIFYFFMCIYQTRRFVILNKIEQIIIFLFYQIGKGSYMLYVSHYIILILCNFYHLNLYETIVALLTNIIFSIKLEALIHQSTFEKRAVIY
jgi:peptidoglycan/LPS O-acetylase OafA/YrhL